MRILTPHTSPKISAQILDDKTLRIQVIETAKILSSVIRTSYEFTLKKVCKRGKITPYQLYSKKIIEPDLNVWCVANVMWVYQNLLYLLQEHERRFGNIHAKSAKIYNIFFEIIEEFKGGFYDIGDMQLPEPAPLTRQMKNELSQSNVIIKTPSHFFDKHLKYLAITATSHELYQPKQSIYLDLDTDKNVVEVVVNDANSKKVVVKKPYEVYHKGVDIEKFIPKKKRKNFRRPTAIELGSYALSINFRDFAPQRFLDYYNSNGWKIGKNPMKNWMAAVRTWKRNSTKYKWVSDTNSSDPCDELPYKLKEQTT